ncbi:hypothetical protein HPB51_007531 [Rhipicephalus microplus]|uniref:Uncharacterized protein n=1 Tax=Rhipicephalus microplus TaxID=6941 RepID=A0A9J6E817_RHIMP|nr:hypothetical protein HPB51_007531 [Rhipicephalus microplus]
MPLSPPRCYPSTTSWLSAPIRAPADEEVEEEVEGIPEPTSSLVVAALDLLRRYVCTSDDGKSHMALQGSRDCGACINREGYLDVMPSNRKKATYWNPWRRRYMRLQDGTLSCLEARIDVAVSFDFFAI